MDRLMVVDSSEDMRKQLKWAFGREYSLIIAATAAEAFALQRKHRPRVVVLDAGPASGQETGDGLGCLVELLALDAYVKVIIVSGAAGAGVGVRAVEKGAYDYLKKPIDLGELKVIIKRAFHLHRLEEENRKLRLARDRKGGAATGMVGQCRAMIDVSATIRKVAPSDVGVLIQGESGTGKELAARAIHAASRRRDGNFVVVSCGAVPANLLEAELFGQEQGDGPSCRGGIASARGGTLFLDEIGELAVPVQSRLLRLLQPGADEGRLPGMRIVTATSRAITDDVREGRFREDLYYRLAVVTLRMPPLREREDDRTILATLFLMRYAEAFRKRVKGFSSAALDQIEAHAWPGNVRELENRVQRAVVLSEGPLIEPYDLGFGDRPPASAVPPMPGTTLKDARDRIERQMVILAMDRRKGNIAQAAEDLGISRPTFYDIMKKHGLFHMANQQSQA